MVLRHLGPSPQLFDHTVDEQLVDLVGVGPDLVVFLIRETNRILTRIFDGFLDRLDLDRRQILARLPSEPRAVSPIRPLDHRNDRLGGHVPANQEGVGLVELRSREELAEDDFRAVKIRREKQSLEFVLLGAWHRVTWRSKRVS